MCSLAISVESRDVIHLKEDILSEIQIIITGCKLATSAKTFIKQFVIDRIANHDKCNQRIIKA